MTEVTFLPNLDYNQEEPNECRCRWFIFFKSFYEIRAARSRDSVDISIVSNAEGKNISKVGSSQHQLVYRYFVNDNGKNNGK